MRRIAGATIFTCVHIWLQVRRLSVTTEAPQPSGKPAAPWTLLFSATWTARTAKLAKAMLAPGAVHVTVGGEQTAAAASVTQRVEVLKAKLTLTLTPNLNPNP